MSLTIVKKDSPNFTKGKKENAIIVIHSTASNNGAGGLSWLCNPDSGVSAHYMVDRDGTIYQLVDEANIAWHAGKSAWQIGSVMRTDLNLYSIGIEVVADQLTPFTEIQKQKLAELTLDIMKRHKLSSESVVRHLDIATPKGRKSDPYGPNMNWEAFKALLNVPYETAPVPPPHFAAEVQAEFIKRGFLTHTKNLDGAMPWGEGLVVMGRIYDSLRLK